MSTHKTVKVRTTLPTQPLPPNSERPHIHTQRLVVRPMAQADLAGFHAMRTQPEVMKFSIQGRVDRNTAETQVILDGFLPSHNSAAFTFAASLAAADGKGEFIGLGGTKANRLMGWPELGYSFLREHWGRGYASEFLTAWLAAYWQLPRSVVEEHEVDARTVPAEGGGVEVPEQLLAIVEASHAPSIRILEKHGFRLAARWPVVDDREGFEGNEAELLAYVLSRPDQ